MQPPANTDRDECLDAETLAAYVDGLLAHDQLARADRHIDHCGTCRGELSALAAAGTFPAGSARPLPIEQMPVVEGRLGRYQVEHEIGRGNMGVVVRAHDPELARSVAIKILAPKWGNHGTDARERLRREAQAMARLSHPNVVQVYDVTWEGESLAIAMELVDGTTLREKIGCTPWQELLAICARAGQGLAAAHAAKLIHRDYKPENVLVANDGRVLVSDFGLARVDVPPASMPADAPLTRTTLAGTPAYIAPELLRGEHATIASDQFSYCVATYEALYGERPFAGNKLDELRANMTAGIVRAAPAGSRIPPSVRTALLRGLSPDPAKRWSSIAELLDALQIRRRKVWPYGVATAALAGAATVLVLKAPETSCDISENDFQWDRNGVMGALPSSPDEARIIAGLDRYKDSWLIARRNACEATVIRHELSERVLDARNACLDRSRREMIELTKLVMRDPSAASLEAIGRLRDPYGCTPDVRGAAVDPDVDRASALVAGARPQEALAIIERVLDSTRSDATRAEGLLLRARAEIQLDKVDAAEHSLNDAIKAAEQARADELVAAIWVELVQVTGAQTHRFEAAQAMMRATEAAFARSDPGPALRARYAYNVGTMFIARGDAAAAKAELDKALAVHGGARAGELGLVHAALCDAHRQLRELDKAREHCKTAVGLLTEAYGPDHSRLAVTYNISGIVEIAAKQYDAAREKLGQAMRIYEARGLVSDRTYALAISNVAVTYMEQRDPAHARPLFERARDLFAAHHPEHAQRVIPLQGLASVAYEEHDMRGTIAAYEESLEVIEKVYGKEDTRRTSVLYNLAIAYNRLPDRAKAVALTDEVIAQSQHPGREQWAMVAYALDMQAAIAEKTKDWARAVALREKALAALDHKDDVALRAWINMEIGRVLRSSGQIAKSREPLERAVAYFVGGPDAQRSALAQFWLAKTLWETNADRKRAVELAQKAHSDVMAVKVGLNIETHRTQITEWLKKFGPK